MLPASEALNLAYFSSGLSQLSSIIANTPKTNSNMQLLTKAGCTVQLLVVTVALFCYCQSISSRVQKSKANVEAIQTLMGNFSHRAFITRKSRGSTLLIFSDIEESVSKQHTLISRTGDQIHKLLQVYSLTLHLYTNVLDVNICRTQSSSYL